MTLLHRLLDGENSSLLVRTQEAEAVDLDEARALGFMLPGGFRGIAGALREDDVIIGDDFIDEAPRVGNAFLVASDRGGSRERRDEVGVTPFEVPEVVQVTVREDDEAAVLGLGVFTRLLLAHERSSVLGLGFEDDEREALFIEEQEVDVALADLLEVLAECIEVLRFQRDTGFKLDVRGAF